jgi:hypothetical protein
MGQKRQYGKHKTLPRELKPAWDWLCTLPEVSRIVLGVARSAGHRSGVGTLHPQIPTRSALKVLAMTERGVMELWVYTQRAERVAQLIRERYDGRRA